MTIQQTFDSALSHYGNGQLQETESLCRQIIASQPSHAGALHLLGVVAHQAGHAEPAVELIRRAIAADPNTAEYHSNLAAILTALGQPREAADASRRAIELNPSLAEAHYNLGNAMRDANEPQAASAAYRDALTLRLDYPQAHNNLGNVLRRLGEFDQAEGAYRDALFFKPDYAEARSILKDAGRIDEAIEAHRLAIEMAPASAAIHSNLIVALHYAPIASAQAIADECKRWNETHGEPLRALAPGHDKPRSSESRTLRIGFVTPDLQMHPIAPFLLPLFETRDRSAFEFAVYATGSSDGASQRLQEASAQWRDVGKLTDEALAQTIRDDRIDIAVDLAGHTAHNRLLVFARHPAPIQVSYLGLNNPTGLSTIRYRLSDALCDPVGSETSGERLLRLPCAWCFAAASNAAPMTPLPALRSGAFVRSSARRRNSNRDSSRIDCSRASRVSARSER